MNLEYFCVISVKPDIVCSICKGLFNSVAECKKHLCSSWSGMVMNIMDVFHHWVRRFGFTLFSKPWKQLSNPFNSLRNCREMELVIHSSPLSSQQLFIWQNSLSVHCPRWIIYTAPTETLLLNEFWPFQCHNCHRITFEINPWCCLQHVILLPQSWAN